MISVIVCSVSPKNFDRFEKSLSETIGCEYQLIKFDNESKNWAISKVYNECTQGARYDVVLYVHEDVIFKTAGWGRLLSDCLSDKSISAVGISGTTYRSRYPAVWAAVPLSYHRITAVQHWKDRMPTRFDIRDGNGATSRVAVLDGVFLATRNPRDPECRLFDELFDRFHHYDMDFSLNIGRRGKLLVHHGIELVHFSEGKLDREWIDSAGKFYKKWKHALPKSVAKLSRSDIRILESQSAVSFSHCCIKNRAFNSLFYMSYCQALLSRYVSVKDKVILAKHLVRKVTQWG